MILRKSKIGSLEPGKLADFLVLNKDYLTVTIEEMETIFPMMTVVGGRMVYLRDEFATELGMQPSEMQIRFRFEEEQ